MLDRSATQPAADAVRGHRLDGRPPAETRRYPAGRRCAAERCMTRLSRYNPSPYCWVHEAPRAYFLRADRSRPPEDGPVVVGSKEVDRLLRGA